MSRERKPVVTFVTRILPHYRIPFHERVRALLAEQGIDYRLIHGQPNAREAAKGDLATLPWARQVRNRAILGRDTAIWQPVLGAILRSDLAVLGQENRQLVNYIVQSLPRRLRPRIGLFGHGPNFQSADWTRPAERWRKWWAPRCDWWFAYTDASLDYVRGTGFPDERITVFNNAVDTDTLRAQAEAVTAERIAARRAELGLAGTNSCIYVGAIYDYKRIGFLIESADRIRAAVPDFELLVVGTGVDAPIVAEAARTRPWLRPLGPRFGTDKVELMRASRLFLMPGLLGLAVLDAAAVGLPVVTTDYRHHSPEIVYLRDGETGIVTRPFDDVPAYADAVIALLRDPARIERMADAATGVAARYTVAEMARRFAEGAAAALRAPKR